MRLSLPVRGAVLAGLGLLFAVGCSSPPPPPVKVTGKVTRGGKPIELSKTEHLRVILTKEVPPGTPPVLLLAKAAPDGNFTFDRVPPGKYRVAVQQMDEATRRDVLEGAFSAGETPFIEEIDGPRSLELDLERRPG